MAYGGLRTHLRNKHQSRNVKYDKDLVTEARYHKCQICSMLVLCDHTMLRNHVRNAHKTNVPKYFSNHVLKNGGKSIPTYTDFKKDNNVFETFIADEKQSENPLKHDLILPSMLSSESEDSD